jgi:hypothetical protein
MASTYVNALRLNEMGTGDESGSWGTVTNLNLDMIGEAFGYGAEAIADASTHTITMADGAVDEARNIYLKCTGGGQACTVTLAPNTVSKIWIIENATSYTLTFSQGSGANVAIPASDVKVIATDGAGSGAVVYDLFVDLNIATKLTIKNPATSTSPATLLLQSGDTAVVDGDVLGKIQFQAPDETGADAILVAAAIEAVATDTFAADNNATKLSFKTGASEAATEKMSISSAGTVTMTGDVTLSASDGAAITGVASINAGQIGGNRSLIYNGAMTISQRATTASLGTSADGYFTLDRWRYVASGSLAAVVTMTQSTDVPSGEGFGYSMKFDCTTAESTLGSTEQIRIDQRWEGQDLQHLKKGTSNAEALMLSFWIKSTKTGTYIATLYDFDNNRIISKAYTVSSGDTWEKKTIAYAGDTSDPLTNDNGLSLGIQFFLVAGTDYTSGTLQTTWADVVNTTWATGQVNALDNTSNNVLFTGVQLEIGSTASAFQYEKTNENLARCQRYYAERAASNAILYGSSVSGSGSNYSHWQFHVPMRAAPTMTGEGGGSSGNTQQQISVDSGGSYAAAGTYATWGNGSTADAEI